MDMMMALRAHARGGAEQLVYEDAPVPVAAPGEALVAVHAAAAAFAELTWDLSWTTRDGRDRTPVIPAHEMSGTVAGPGGAAAGVAPGDEVYGLIGFFEDQITPDPGELAQLAGLVDTGRPGPVVSQVFPLTGGRRAFGSAGRARPPGKTVLTLR
ncbi:MAG TPA: hypothetical protein VF933_24995 [Streptosporangiaceae bacterium]